MRGRFQVITVLFVAIALCGRSALSVAQTPPTRTVTVRVAAPIFLYPDERRQPLVVAKEGSILRVVGEDGNWFNVEFRDPAVGVRQGFIQKQNVTAPAADYSRVPSTDVSVPAPSLNEPERNATQASPSSSAQSSRSQTPPDNREQRGDVAFGYVFLHASSEGFSYNLPLGIAASDAWRLNPNVDFVLESQYAHGNVDILGVDVSVSGWSLFAGPRFWGGSRYGENVRAFGQVVGGLVVEKAAFLGVDLGTDRGWGIQPGGGVEVPVSRSVAIRPQFDLLIAKAGDAPVETDTRFNVNVVFRLFKK